jgi:hypothetical protein
MSKATAKAGKIVWIEPNKIDSISDTGTFDYEDYSICEEVLEDNYLQVYDDIVIEGKNLYDGKIVG